MVRPVAAKTEAVAPPPADNGVRRFLLTLRLPVAAGMIAAIAADLLLALFVAVSGRMLATSQAEATRFVVGAIAMALVAVGRSAALRARAGTDG